MPHSETTQLTAELPSSLVEKVDALAARNERSRDWVVKQALLAWVDRESERNRLTREAIADADAGQVIDHAAVKAWADSLGTDNPLPLPTSHL